MWLIFFVGDEILILPGGYTGEDNIITVNIPLSLKGVNNSAFFYCLNSSTAGLTFQTR